MRIFANRASQRQPNLRRTARRAIRRGDVAAARTLAETGVPGLQALVDAFRGRKRHTAALLLHEALDRFRRDRSLCLADLKIREATLSSLLRDHQAIVRCVSLRIAGYSGQPRWIPLVAAVLTEDADAFVRCRAADALGDLVAVETTALLMRVIEDERDPARYHALRALGRLGEAACRELVRLSVDHPDEMLRREAAETVARVGPPAAWEILLAALAGETSCQARRTFVEALGRSRSDRAIAPLIECLAHDASPVVREAAAEALARLGDARSIAALLDCALHDPFTEAADDASGSPVHWRYPVREAAAEALVVLGRTEENVALADTG